MSDYIKPSNLSRLSILEMQSYGEIRFAEPFYRIEVARRLAASTRTSRLITFDDVINAVPEGQRTALHGLPGYERHLMHTLLLAPGFKDGAVAISSAPPNPVELVNIHKSKSQMEKVIGRKIQFAIYFKLSDREFDLMQVGMTEYQALCEYYAELMDDPTNAQEFSRNTFLSELAAQNIHTLTQGKRALAIPFEMTQMHADYLSGHVELPEIPRMDKVYNKLILLENGFANVNPTIAVTPSGKLITAYSEYDAYKRDRQKNRWISSEENIKNFAVGIIEAIDRFNSQGLKAFVKLDSLGVSGISNLHPEVYGKIYDPNIPISERLALLVDLISASKSKYLPDTAIVEEFVKPKINGGVNHDATYGGISVNGEFLPMSVFPFGTDENGVYTHGWISSDPSEIDESSTEWQKGFKVFADMTKILGLQTGIVAGDAFTTPQDNLIVHDWNLRRGGRSHVEAFIVLNKGGWFEVQVEVPLHRRMTNLDLYKAYFQVCASLANEQIAPYSTSFGYFGKGGSHDFMKFKLMVPLQILEGSGGPQRNKHHEIVENHVSAMVHKLVG